MENPYGAVPEALKETRLTLRDVMGDYLQNKILDGRMNLEMKKAETETALVQADMKKSELADLRDLSKMRMTREMETERQNQQNQQFQQDYNLKQSAQETQARQFGKTYSLQEQELEQRRVAQEAANKIAGRQVAVSEREAAAQHETKTAAEWAQLTGKPAGVLAFLNIDPNMKVTRRDAKDLKDSLDVTFKAYPALEYVVQGQQLKSELTGLQTQLKEPGLPPEKRTVIQSAYDKKLTHFENLDTLITNARAPSQEKIIQAARQTYTDTPQLQTQYPQFDKFLDAFQKDATQARSVFQKDIKEFKSAGSASPVEQQTALTDLQKLVAEVKTGKYTNLSTSEMATIRAFVGNVTPETAPFKLSALQRILKQGGVQGQEKPPVQQITPSLAETAQTAAASAPDSRSKRVPFVTPLRNAAANIQSGWDSVNDFMNSTTAPLRSGRR